jgi:hypothetical protein
MSDPISRLEFAQSEVDRVFGTGYASAHPDVVSAVMISASLDWAAERVSAAIVEASFEPEPQQLARVTSQLLR